MPLPTKVLSETFRSESLMRGVQKVFKQMSINSGKIYSTAYKGTVICQRLSEVSL